MPTDNYEKELIESLKNREEAAAYLTACLEESEEVFLLGLRQVVNAHGGVGQLAEATGLNRESLYRMLSGEGNPRLSSLATILHALGIRPTFSTVEAA